MPEKKPGIIVCDDIEEIAEKAAFAFAETARSAVSERGLFCPALSGGSTPKPLYRLLCADRFKASLDWGRTHLFWGDERRVPPTHRESNFLMAYNSLIRKLSIPEDNIHRIKAEKGEGAAQEYEHEIRDFFKLAPGAFPEFDLIILGMGSDGHIASIFPKTPAAKENKRIVTSVYVEKLGSWRITITPPVIKNARNIIVLVSGREKAGTLADCLAGDPRPEELPVQITRLAKGTVRWFVDKAAAGRLYVKEDPP